MMYRVALTCNDPRWNIRRGHAVVGASSPVQQSSVQACLNYCVLTANCFGVDVDFNTSPVRCWPHTNAGDYVESNYYFQPGTDSYQLLERCVLNTSSVSPTTNQAVLGM